MSSIPTCSDLKCQEHAVISVREKEGGQMVHYCSSHWTGFKIGVTYDAVIYYGYGMFSAAIQARTDGGSK